MSKFIVEGGRKLHGSIAIGGSKNAALPLLSACLLTEEECVLENVPDIVDVHMFLELIKDLGAEVFFEKNIVKIRAKELEIQPVLDKKVKKMRASILLLGSLVSRLGTVEIAYPGGCILGKRTVRPHMYVFDSLGAYTEESPEYIKVKVPAKGLKGSFMVLPEISVTATENAILAAVKSHGETKIHLAAAEPHVQDLCDFLNKMGAKITGIGTNFLTIQGVSSLGGARYSVTPDYLETGTLSIAALLTRSELTLTNVVPKHLDSFWQKLRQAGVKFELTDTTAHFYPTERFMAVEKLQTAVYPGFATDLQAPFSVLLTQAEGRSMIFETLFEDRLNYLFELEKMGAKVKISNPYVAYVDGPTNLKGCAIASCDIRAGAAMVLAALVADSVTEISNINYIDRGYERLDEKLNRAGAKIERIFVSP